METPHTGNRFKHLLSAATLKRSVLWALIALVLTVLVLSTIARRQHGEPVFNGRELRSWLRDLDDLKSDQASNAMEAVHQMDTNSIPTLLKMVSSKDAKPKRFLIWALSKQPVFIFDLRSADQQHFEAYIAFRVLKGRAKPAIPALSRALRDSDADISNCALRCLLGIGPDAREALENARCDRNSSVRKMAESALAVLESETSTN
jgi:hypothetical protein